MLVIEIPINAGKYIYPMLKLGNSSICIPVMMYPRVPKIAIGIPHAAEVPIAVVKFSPVALKYGTENVPPPIPRIEERKPIEVPAKTDLGLLTIMSVFMKRILKRD